MQTINGLYTTFVNTIDGLPYENDIYNTTYLRTDGSNYMTNDLDMDNHNIKNLDTPTTNDEATNKLYVDTQDNLRVLKTGDTMTGALNLNYSSFIANLLSNKLMITTGTTTILSTDYALGVLNYTTTATTGNIFYDFNLFGGGASNVSGFRFFRSTNANFPRVSILRGDNTLTEPIRLDPRAISYFFGQTGDTCRVVIGSNALINATDILSLYGNSSQNGKSTIINTVDGINTGWSLTSPFTLLLGNATRNACIQLVGSQNSGRIQMTTRNLHFDINDNSNAFGVYTNTYSPNANTYLNNSSGTGCVLIGTNSFQSNYKVSIDKQGKAHAMLVNGNIDMNTTNTIINAVDPTNAQDVATKNYVDNGLTGYVNITGNQTITGVKTFSVNQLFVPKSAIFQNTDNTGANYNYVAINANHTPVAYNGILFTETNNNKFFIGQTGSVLSIMDFRGSPSEYMRFDTEVECKTSLNMTNHIINNLATPSVSTDATNKSYVDNASTANNTNNFTYNNEDVIMLSTVVNKTITFNNLPAYYTGKRFEMVLNNNGLFTVNITLSITTTGTFPNGTTSKTIVLTTGQIKRYSCLIENFNLNYLYVSELTYI